MAAFQTPRWRAVRRYLVDHFLTIDARSAALGRVAVSIVLLVDLIRRIPILDLFYTNEGLLPNHTLLWRPPTQWMFSFFFLASLRDEAILCFAICGFVYLALLVGWRTTLMRFLAPVCLVSLHARVTLVENGGDWMLGELILWSAFLPLGRRFSVDAVRASLRRRPETTAAELADRAAMATLVDQPGTLRGFPDPPATTPLGAAELRQRDQPGTLRGFPDPPATTPLGAAELRQRDQPGGDVNRVVSLAAFTIVFQLAVSYFFNAIQKGGQTWHQGSAVHYVLYQNRMVTWFGVWMRPHMTPALSRIFSYAALTTESALPILVLAPFKRVWLRRAAVVTVIGLHIGFQLFINLGIFSWAMIAYTPFLLTSADWELAARWASRSRRRLTIYFDAGCGVCFHMVRVLARLDVFGRLKLVANDEAPAKVPGVSRALIDQTVVVVDDVTGRVSTRGGAVADVLRALPLGPLWSWPFRVPGLRGLANLAYDVFASRRAVVSYWLGYGACGVPGSAPAIPDVPSRPPIVMWLSRGVGILHEGAVLAMLIVLVNEALFINPIVPRFLKFDEPLWVKRLVAYPRLIQAWQMFAADAPTEDESVAVDAVTAEGRHVDPYSEVASRYPNPGTDQIPSRLDNDSFFFNYSVRIPDQSVYHGAFLEWILDYPKRTGHPGDRIIRFDAYKIENNSPPPGETTSRNTRKHIFLSYPRAP